MSKKYIIAKNVMTEYRSYVFEQKVKQASQQDVEILSYEDRLEYHLVAEKVVKKDQAKAEKRKCMDFVYLTAEEYQTLVAEYGELMIKKFIVRLNDYIGSKGDKYKSHYYTLLMRLKKDGVKKLGFKPTPTSSSQNKPISEEEKQKSLELLQKAREILTS